ncbi:hypothetical protein C0581_01325 [Candidatus Parcubacteria bacterium]|nr:MAG: hypothetical protein C0581_01325 [Candidatus Parcubacteria bacterium]
MDERKQKILQLIVESYTSTAEPVGSKFLVEECGLDVSGATVRNEMRDLEEQGYLTHPHTSSGRMPTEMGYEYYVERIMKPRSLSKKIQQELESAADDDRKQHLKTMAKYIAEKSQSAVIVAFGEDSLYYTGISNLFSQAEFRDYAYAVRVSTIFDQVEERIDSVFEILHKENPEILIGGKNPFGAMCGLVGGQLADGALFAILGPLRMDYAQGSSFIDYLQKQS